MELGSWLTWPAASERVGGPRLHYLPVHRLLPAPRLLLLLLLTFRLLRFRACRIWRRSTGGWGSWSRRWRLSAGPPLVRAACVPDPEWCRQQ